MNWKNRLTNYNFWISIFSAVLLILQALKIEFDIAYVNEIFTAVLGLLVVIGIISDPTRTSVKSTENSKNEEVNSLEQGKLSQATTKEVNEQKTLPIDEKNEINNINFQNDIQTVLNIIKEDLTRKINEMDVLTKETASCLVDFNRDKAIKCEIPMTEVDIDNVTEEPAAAETDNPYFNIMQ